MFLVIHSLHIFSFFFFNDTATTEIYTLSLHDALPISFAEGSESAPTGNCLPPGGTISGARVICRSGRNSLNERSEEHTSELQSQSNLVCRLLLEKKNKTP